MLGTSTDRRFDIHEILTDPQYVVALGVKAIFHASEWLLESDGWRLVRGESFLTRDEAESRITFWRVRC